MITIAGGIVLALVFIVVGGATLAELSDWLRFRPQSNSPRSKRRRLREWERNMDYMHGTQWRERSRIPTSLE